MKRNIRICSNILLLVIIISFFDFPAYTSYSINHSYYNTRGQEFLKNLKANEKESDIRKKIPYYLDFFYENNRIDLKSDILYKNNRIYISLSEFIKHIGYKEKILNDEIKIDNDISININEKSFYKDNNKVLLRGDIFIENQNYYISFFDLCEILSLNTYWDYDSNKIYIDKKIYDYDITDIAKGNKKKGYIRFEDFTAGDIYLSKGSLEKIRLVADYMNNNKEDFSVAWVPRYINNDNNIDNDISKEESMKNANFVFTLDYIVNKGGVIGLHGYTHQCNNSNSVAGFEFGDDGYKDLEEIRKRVEDSLTIANVLNIPIGYWETPHYNATDKQQKIFEEYFKIIYEPAMGIFNKNIITSVNNEFTKYIPTPLGYVDDDNGYEIMNRMKRSDEGQEFSLFYHLSMEVKSIDIWISENGSILYKYDENSILRKIVNLADELGYRFSNINDI